MFQCNFQMVIWFVCSVRISVDDVQTRIMESILSLLCLFREFILKYRGANDLKSGFNGSDRCFQFQVWSLHWFTQTRKRGQTSTVDFSFHPLFQWSQRGLQRIYIGFRRLRILESTIAHVCFLSLCDWSPGRPRLRAKIGFGHRSKWVKANVDP